MRDDCINWTGLTWSQGRYGMEKFEGRCMGAHRAAWIRANGPIPDGLLVCHKCDNGLCVNLDHLFLGTPSDNMQDCIRKGRATRNCQKGQLNHNAKPHLERRNRSIRRDVASGMTWRAVREKYGIKSNGHLREILLDIHNTAIPAAHPRQLEF